ncbi:Oidioi.mRNA.OKI2018_I69.XSR.g14878.t1.cds [Oikopleura dioica]|uniref:Oidioi.mRNA.OKI2018_I69.XSR.g14878.t1.cds n=1 Tax=Oikopleura dioica TaxID=34765 RepID=A0ABN7SIE7_OIKDI|nr:Oidioi.mRNA.OKI2018_I69.XSR.g14878.t1.cds [Oikopleura dioica]
MTLSERLARIYLGRKLSGASSKKEKMSSREKSTPIQTPTIYSEIDDEKSDSVLMSSQSEASSVRSVTPKTSLDQSLRTIPQDSFVTDGRSRTKTTHRTLRHPLLLIWASRCPLLQLEYFCRCHHQNRLTDVRCTPDCSCLAKLNIS